MTSKDKKPAGARGTCAATPAYPAVEPRTGHLLAVPLSDGTYTLAHIALHEVTSIAVFFAHRRRTPDELFDGIDEAMRGEPIAILSVVANEPWPVIALEDPLYASGRLDTKRTYQATHVRGFLDAYYGLRAWDEANADHTHDEMLAPGVGLPLAVRLAHDSQRLAAGGEEIAQAKSGKANRALRRRKRDRVKTGQLAAVPLSDGTYALAHVALYHGSIFTAHLDHREKSPEQLLEGLREALNKRPIAMLAVTSDEIEDGHWPIIGHAVSAYPAKMLDMKGTSYTASMSRCLFEAYYGLRPWDEMHDPRYYEKALLSGVPVPPTVRYKRDFEKDTAAKAASATSASSTDITEASITAGPAVIHIEIRYPGDALPSIDLLHRRQALERALEEAGAGEVTDAGGGGGVMDVYLDTKDVRHAVPLVEAAVKQAGFGKDTTIETLPSDSDDPAA